MTTGVVILGDVTGDGVLNASQPALAAAAQRRNMAAARRRVLTMVAVGGTNEDKNAICYE